jgi:hypothetical protein
MSSYSKLYRHTYHRYFFQLLISFQTHRWVCYCFCAFSRAIVYSHGILNLALYLFFVCSWLLYNFSRLAFHFGCDGALSCTNLRSEISKSFVFSKVNYTLLQVTGKATLQTRLDIFWFKSGRCLKMHKIVILRVPYWIHIIRGFRLLSYNLSVPWLLSPRYSSKLERESVMYFEIQLVAGCDIFSFETGPTSF